MCGQITQNYYENSLRKIMINKNHLPLRAGELLKVTMETENKKLRLIKITYHYLQVDHLKSLWKQKIKSYD